MFIQQYPRRASFSWINRFSRIFRDVKFFPTGVVYAPNPSYPIVFTSYLVYLKAWFALYNNNVERLCHPWSVSQWCV